MSHPNTLSPENTALIVIDVQEAFRAAIPDFALIASRISTVVRGVGMLGVSIVVTEQYPKGLGHTAEEIALVLPEGVNVVEKSTFSSCGADAFGKGLEGIRNVILCGVETHVCVNQTAHDLIDSGLTVHLLEDCVASRFEHDKQAALSKMRIAGVIPASVEMALFELMRDTNHERFKDIQALIK